jgi:hypothetical protein
VACLLTADECFRKHVAATLDVTERAQGWWSMRCPTGRHGAPLRLHVGRVVHITYADLGKCPQSETYAWLVKQGIPAGCLAQPKDRPRPASRPGDDGKLADAILDAAFGDGTPAERLVRITLLALDGEMPEGPVCDAVAANLRLSSRLVYRATEERRRECR